MMTWEGYFIFKLLCALGILILTPIFWLLVALSDSRYCKQCGRNMQFRWRRPSPWRGHLYCASHDEGP